MSEGIILRPRLNGVLMALEGGWSGKVRVPAKEVKLTENEWWGYKVGLHFRETGVTKLLPMHTV